MKTENNHITKPEAGRAKIPVNFIVIFLLLFLLSGCADNVPVNTGMVEVGFWHGLWHGMILPFAWFISLFSDSTAIYAVYNSGGWYDFGFLLGVGSLSSSGVAASR